MFYLFKDLLMFILQIPVCLSRGCSKEWAVCWWHSRADCARGLVWCVVERGRFFAHLVAAGWDQLPVMPQDVACVHHCVEGVSADYWAAKQSI